jgi:mono/diheme cytochrome c family protein
MVQDSHGGNSPRPHTWWGLRGLFGLGLLLIATSLLAANPTPEQRAKLKTVADAIRKAENLIKAKKADQAAEALQEAHSIADELAGEDKSHDLLGLANLQKQIKKLETSLPAKGNSEAKAGSDKGDAPSATGTVSFTKQVAPMLVAHCGRCHVAKASGGLSMASYSALMAGTKEGVSVVSREKDGKGSRIVEVIEEGSMPKGGGKVPEAELALLTRWINQGAKFDGTNQQAALSPNAGGPAGKATIEQATGKEPVQFARDLGPIILEHCASCHGGDNPPQNFSTASLARMIRGGIAGAGVMPGDPANSLLIQKLKGTADKGERMPRKKPPLSDEIIAKFETWIKLNAKDDVGNPELDLEKGVARVWARHASHEDLFARREKTANKNWRSILPDVAGDSKTTATFRVLSSLSPERITEIADAAEQQAALIAKSLKVNAKPFVKGGVTLFAFSKHYDYAEVGERLEHRVIPVTATGHWFFDEADAYVCVLASSKDQAALSANLCGQITGVYLASQGAPHWFAEGSARALRARLYPKDTLLRTWEDQIPTALQASNGKVSGYLTAKATGDDADAFAYGFCKGLMGNMPRWHKVLRGLQEGEKFDAAFVAGFEQKPDALASEWANHYAATSGKARAAR